MPIVDIKNCTFKIKDGGSNSVEIVIGEGNLQYTEKRNVDYVRSRGRIDSVKEGQDEPVEVSFEFTWKEIKSITGSDAPTIEEALKKTGAASAWVSSDSDPCNPYCVDLEITHDPVCSGATTQASKEIVTLPDFRYESLAHDYKAATVSCTGKCNAKVATVTRASNT